MLERFNTNPTQLTGLLSFAVSTIACFIASRRSETGDVRAWRSLTLINGLFFFEILIGLRFYIHDRVNFILIAKGWYLQRSWIQESIDISLAAIALVFVVLFMFLRRPAGNEARIAAGLTIALVALFAVETVSLHAIDSVLYQPIGPVLLIGWIWAIGSFGICLSAAQR